MSVASIVLTLVSIAAACVASGFFAAALRSVYRGRHRAGGLRRGRRGLAGAAIGFLLFLMLAILAANLADARL